LGLAIDLLKAVKHQSTEQNDWFRRNPADFFIVKDVGNVARNFKTFKGTAFK
jgi:hypothetical protein